MFQMTTISSAKLQKKSLSSKYFALFLRMTCYVKVRKKRKVLDFVLHSLNRNLELKLELAHARKNLSKLSSSLT